MQCACAGRVRVVQLLRCASWAAPAGRAGRGLLVQLLGGLGEPDRGRAGRPEAMRGTAAEGGLLGCCGRSTAVGAACGGPHHPHPQQCPSHWSCSALLWPAGSRGCWGRWCAGQQPGPLHQLQLLLQLPDAWQRRQDSPRPSALPGTQSRPHQHDVPCRGSPGLGPARAASRLHPCCGGSEGCCRGAAAYPAAQGPALLRHASGWAPPRPLQQHAGRGTGPAPGAFHSRWHRRG